MAHEPASVTVFAWLLPSEKFVYSPSWATSASGSCGQVANSMNSDSSANSARTDLLDYGVQSPETKIVSCPARFRGSRMGYRIQLRTLRHAR